MKKSESINEIAKAMAEAQKEMKPASKDAVNPFFKSKYTTLSAIWDAVRTPFTSNNLMISQDVVTSEKTVSVTTTIVHSSGQWFEFGPLTIPLAKFDAQTIGSATSYAKRYSLSAATGVVSEEDDDGEAAMKHARQAQAKPPVQQPVVEKKVTHHEAELLTEMLAKDPEFKDSVETFILENLGQNAIIDLKYKDYEKIYKRTKQHFEEKEKKNE